MTTNRKDRCELCRFWDSDDEPPSLEDVRPGNPIGLTITTKPGLCRRYPPYKATDDRHGWPVTEYSDWCGEFQPAADELELQ